MLQRLRLDGTPGTKLCSQGNEKRDMMCIVIFIYLFRKALRSFLCHFKMWGTVLQPRLTSDQKIDLTELFKNLV